MPPINRSPDDSPDRNIFDRTALLQSIHGDHELLTQFIELFLKDFPDKMAALHAATPAADGTEPGDRAALRNAAHKILGSARTMRLNRLADAALDLQRLVDTEPHHLEQLAAGSARVTAEYERVVAILRR
ncbi:MAG: Hpt domain-containing protein [Alkalispirochaeta sp.]